MVRIIFCLCDMSRFLSGFLSIEDWFYHWGLLSFSNFPLGSSRNWPIDECLKMLAKETSAKNSQSVIDRSAEKFVRTVSNKSYQTNGRRCSRFYCERLNVQGFFVPDSKSWSRWRQQEKSPWTKQENHGKKQTVCCRYVLAMYNQSPNMRRHSFWWESASTLEKTKSKPNQSNSVEFVVGKF